MTLSLSPAPYRSRFPRTGCPKRGQPLFYDLRKSWSPMLAETAPAFTKNVKRGLTPFLLLLAGAACGMHAQRPAGSDVRSLARDILRELIQTPTTEAEGTAAAARTLAARLTAAGFPSQDV